MKSLMLLLLLFSFSHLLGQSNIAKKWGKVSQEEIEYENVSFEPEAGAVILYEEGHTTVNRVFETEIYRRIKILNERGLDAANLEIPFLSINDIEKIISIEVQTINIENGNISITKVDKAEMLIK